MDKYAELIQDMADAYITLARGLIEEVERLRYENELQRTIIQELREANDTIIEGGHGHE